VKPATNALGGDAHEVRSPFKRSDRSSIHAGLSTPQHFRKTLRGDCSDSGGRNRRSGVRDSVTGWHGSQGALEVLSGVAVWPEFFGRSSSRASGPGSRSCASFRSGALPPHIVETSSPQRRARRCPVRRSTDPLSEGPRSRDPALLTKMALGLILPFRRELRLRPGEKTDRFGGADTSIWLAFRS
jgi:hypothetical protein